MRIHQQMLLISLLIFCLSTRGYAGSTVSPEATEEHRGQGYAFFAEGAMIEGGNNAGTVHFGGGGEGLLYKGLGLGAEAGYITKWRDFTYGIGMLSVYGSYHFNRHAKLSPFVSGGYSMAVRRRSANLYNIGGGVNYWFHDKIGFRLELRDHVYSERSPGIHFLSGRVGFSFR
jgi:hypothetical protein